MQKTIDISVIIVNYNVKEFLSNLLNAIKKAAHNLSIEIFVVDNASSDNSVSYLKKRYPEVIFIENDRNIGFGKANNLAIEKARGTYTLLINPDTLISEDTLLTLREYMNKHPQTGACGCKIVNPDGTFAPESRRSIPTPLSALWKVLGLTTLFPRNKTFAEYYLTWMDEDKPSRVPVLSGAFMFFRSQILKELGGFDEQFFMYGEDIDLCYRVSKAGYQIDYVPSTSIIHYKGESTKKDNIDYIVLFNRAMLQFFRKHYSYSYSIFLRVLIVLGIIVRGVVSYATTLFRRGIQPIIDLGIINIVLIIGFMLRYHITASSILSDYRPTYLIVNGVVSVLFIVGSINHEIYSRQRDSIVAVMKANFWAFGGASLITFFLRQFAFSRLILLVSFIVSLALMAILRLIRKNSGSTIRTGRGTFNSVRVLIVGLNNRTIELARKLQSKIENNYEVIGVLRNDNLSDGDAEGIPVLGELSDISNVIHRYRIGQVLFLLNAMSYKEILHVITKYREPGIMFKLVPESLDFVIGKANVEYLDDMPVVDVDIAYQSTWNRFIKRLFDVLLSFLLLTISSIIMLPGIIFSKATKRLFYLYGNPAKGISITIFTPAGKHFYKNLYLIIWNIFKGKLSFVGAPMKNDGHQDLIYKPGLTGLRQINESRLYYPDDKLKYEIYYLQNYSVWLDIDILIKSLTAKVYSLQFLEFDEKDTL